MLANYKAFITRMIHKYEGDYGWDADDAGGPTKYGITCYDLAEHRGQKMHSMRAWAPIVKAMKLEEAEEIYKNKYAKRLRFDELKTGHDCVILDYGVNSGIGRPIRVARRMLGFPDSTVFSQELLEAINKSDRTWFVNGVCDERMAFLRQLSNWNTFKGGWTARVRDLRLYCMGLKEDVVEVDVMAKGEPNPSKTQEDAAAKGGAGVVGTTTSTFFGVPVEFAITVTVIIVIATVAYIIWTRRRSKKIMETVELPATVVPRPVGAPDNV